MVKVLCIQNKRNLELELNITRCFGVSVFIMFSAWQYGISGFWEAGSSENQMPLFVPQTNQQHKEIHYSTNVPLHWYEQNL